MCEKNVAVFPMPCSPKIWPVCPMSIIASMNDSRREGEGEDEGEDEGEGVGAGTPESTGAGTAERAGTVRSAEPGSGWVAVVISPGPVLVGYHDPVVTRWQAIAGVWLSGHSLPPSVIS